MLQKPRDQSEAKSWGNSLKDSLNGFLHMLLQATAKDFSDVVTPNQLLASLNEMALHLVDFKKV